jgi:L-xylulokinase
MRYLLGLDNGGTFCKAAIFDEDGQQVAAASEPTEVLITGEGRRERELDQLWLANVRVVRQALRQSGLAGGQIAGVSFSGHGKGLYLLDRDNRPLGRGILSTDSRAWKYVQKWQLDGTAASVYARTRQPILACQPVALLAWLQDKEPELFRQIKYIFSVNDYIRYQMTREAAAEYSSFSGSNLIDFHTGAYSRELLALLGLESLYECLPPLREAAAVCGRVTRQAAALTGLKEGTPVAAGMFDIDACGLASGLTDEEHLCLIAGTWGINEFLAPEPVLGSSTTMNSFYCIPGYYLIEESSPTSAGNLEWFIQSLLPEEKKQAEAAGQSIYVWTNRWVQQEPAANDLYYLPFLNGSAEDPRARGTFLGLTPAHTKAQLVQAVYEGIVFYHKRHVERLLQHRSKPSRLQLSGGAANSPVWVQLFADVLQMPVQVVGRKELGAQGAAMAAGIAAGVYADFPEAVRRCVHFNRTVEPRAEYREVYERKYRNYSRIIERLLPLWGELEW